MNFGTKSERNGVLHLYLSLQENCYLQNAIFQSFCLTSPFLVVLYILSRTEEKLCILLWFRGWTLRSYQEVKIDGTMWQRLLTPHGYCEWWLKIQIKIWVTLQRAEWLSRHWCRQIWHQNRAGEADYGAQDSKSGHKVECKCHKMLAVKDNSVPVPWGQWSYWQVLPLWWQCCKLKLRQIVYLAKRRLWIWPEPRRYISQLMQSIGKSENDLLPVGMAWVAGRNPHWYPTMRQAVINLSYETINRSGTS